MATQIYRVQDPNGVVREIEGPAGASEEDVIREAQRLFAAAPPDPGRQMFEQRRRQVGNIVGGAVRGAGSIGSVLTEAARAYRWRGAGRRRAGGWRHGLCWRGGSDWFSRHRHAHGSRRRRRRGDHGTCRTWRDRHWNGHWCVLARGTGSLRFWPQRRSASSSASTSCGKPPCFGAWWPRRRGDQRAAWDARYADRSRVSAYAE